MISVAMTTYNGERYLEEQLESIRKQTRKVDEIIIIDDGSTDHSKQCVKRFCQENPEIACKIKILDTTEGRFGPGAGRNVRSR